jgi:diguanylate cyclase (GGDEF)-like protein
MKELSHLDLLLDPCFWIQADQKIGYLNEAMATLLGGTTRRFLGKESKLIFFLSESLQKQYQRVIGGEEVAPYLEFTVTSSDDRSIKIQSTAQKFDSGVLFFLKNVELESTLHEKYKQELQSKESLIAELTEKYFESQLLLEVVRIIENDQENFFPFDKIFQEIQQKLKIEGSFIFTLNRENEGYKSFQEQMFFADTSDQNFERRLLAQVIRSISEKDVAALADQQTVHYQIFDYTLVATFVFKNRQDAFQVISYFLDRKNSEVMKKRETFLKALSQQVLLSSENRELFNQSVTDEKTKVFNQRYFDSRATQELKRSDRYQRQFALIIFDIDHFKKVNDTYGHQIGDEVLFEIAQAIKSSFRLSDLIARFGGEEFIVLCPETDLQGAFIAADRCRSKISLLKFKDGKGQFFSVTISAGISGYPDQSREYKELFDKADKALYSAKGSGRNLVVIAQ